MKYTEYIMSIYEPRYQGLNCIKELMLFNNLILHYEQSHHDYRTKFSDFYGNVYVFEDNMDDDGINYLDYMSYYKTTYFLHKPKYIYHRIKFLIQLIK